MVLTAICRQDDYLTALFCLRRRRALTPAVFLKRTRLVDQAGFKATWTRWIHDYFEANMSREPHAKYRQFKRFARRSTCVRIIPDLPADASHGCTVRFGRIGCASR